MSLDLIPPEVWAADDESERRQAELAARAAAFMFAGLGILVALAMHASGRHDHGTDAICAAAVVGAGGVWLRRRRLTLPERVAWVSLGILMISAVIGRTDDRYSLLYTAAVCLVTLRFSLRIVIGLCSLILGSYAVALHANHAHGPVESWLVLAGMVGVVVAFVQSLRRRATVLAASDRANRALLDAFFDNAPLGLVLYTPGLRYVRVNLTTALRSGLRPEDFVGRYADDIQPGLAQRIAPVVSQIVRTKLPVVGRELERDGRTLRGSHYPILGGNGEVVLIAAITDDITEQKAVEEKLARLASTDPLTKLSNRAALEDGLTRAIEAADARGSWVGLVFVDLNGFKKVNDRLGHAAGDEVLTIVARRLGRLCREQDLIARLGGDEFVVLVPDLMPAAALETLSALATRTHHAVSQPIVAGRQQTSVTCSVGTAIYPIDAATPAELVAVADRAMYARKRAA